jgi:hypothetical protein
MSSHTLVHGTDHLDPTLVVFGRDGAGKPRSSWFDALSADLAIKAADLMEMRVLKVETEEQRAVARQLAPGRVLASGRVFTPFTRATVFSKIVEFARSANGHDIERPTDRAFISAAKGNASGSPEPQGLASQAAGPGPGYAASSATSPRPQDWDEIGLGSLVLALDSSTEGWFEALVIGINGEALTLKWRDYAEPTFVRRRNQLALLPPDQS